MRMRGGTVLLGLLAGGCSIVSPLHDRQMLDATYAACVGVNGTHPRSAAAGATAAPQCFSLFEETADGQRRAWSGGPLTPGRTLVAWHQPGADASCAGRFTHMTLTGASTGAGRAELATWDPIGRPGHHRQVRWGRGFADRTFALASIDAVTMAAAGARVRVVEGQLDPQNLCFKRYPAY
jgi:hypothetical protein